MGPRRLLPLADATLERRFVEFRAIVRLFCRTHARPEVQPGNRTKGGAGVRYAPIRRTLRQPLDEAMDVTIWLPARSGSQNSSPFPDSHGGDTATVCPFIIAMRRSLAPTPHLDTTDAALENGTSTRCTRSFGTIKTAPAAGVGTDGIKTVYAPSS